jgi:uncharacterized phage-associated protein
MPLSATTVSEIILSLSKPEVGDTISNLKLQKLLYYVQGFNIAAYNKPLFTEKIVAWQYGPVVEEVYNKYKKFGSQAIVLDKPLTDLKSYFGSKKEYELFKDVYNIYGEFSALRLMNMTHQEPPWKHTKIQNEITHDKLKDYFKTRIQK